MSDSIEQCLKNAVDEIAKQENLKDYEIITKVQEFTGDNYVGEVSRIEVRPSDGKTSLHLIVKKAMTSPELRLMMPLATYYKNETYSYTSVIPAFQDTLKKNGIASRDVIKFAKFYKSMLEEFKEAVIMKDMCHDGYMLYDKKKPFTIQQAEAVVKTVAMLHAASFVMKEKDPNLYNELCKNIPNKNNYSEDLSYMSTIFTSYISQIECPVDRKRLNDFGSTAGDMLVNVLNSESTEPYNVICHGDCWNNNMLFKFEEEKVVDVLLIDWQIVRIASPATDLCYMMFMSMDAEYVEEHSEDLFELYYTTLREHLSIMGLDVNCCYPKEIFHQHIKRSMIYGFIMAICAIPMILANPNEAQKVDQVLNETTQGSDLTIPLSELAKKRYITAVNYFLKHGHTWVID